MDKRELQELLSQSYKQENWKKIVQFVFPNVSILSTPKEFPINNPKIKTFRQLGNVRLNDGKNLALFELLLSDNVNIQRNRVELNNEISKYIDQEQIHGVLSVFEQGTEDYRFTFSARSTEFNEHESDFVQKKTDTKRYTYVLGKNESCKTPAERFFKLSEKKNEVDINAIQNAFSVEQLSKEFFEKYKKQFEKFWKYIHTNPAFNKIIFGFNREKGIRDFTKKLLGRIVFLHFLQKKGWMGCTAGIEKWQEGDKQFMQSLFDNFSKPDEFHSKCLAELFYSTLNTKRSADIFTCDGLSGALNNSKVPYLNGGLFDSDEEITRRIDFPANYFKELFEFFGQYNFTIDENDPNEHEVGIDPEMLGHIFENLLEDNKDKGAFYTPKVIVQYMCQESIIEYVNTKINEDETEDIKSAVEDLIRNKLAEKCIDLDLVHPISKALFEVKICDPAIGSGAFPMGILNVIFSTIEELYFIQPDSVATIWNISDTEWQPHLVKKNIIQHSIYGVDIESGAVDIARLRFWLALVVDENEPLPLPNLDYKIMQGNSLLESFEGIDLSQLSDASAYEEVYETEQIDMFSGEAKKTVNISLNFEDIKTLMDEYFNANDPNTKKEIHKKIDDQILNHIRFTLLQHKLNLLNKKGPLEKKLKLIEASATTGQQKEKIRTSSDIAKELAKIISDLELFNEKEIKLAQLTNSNERPFFLWQLFFKEVFDDNGFDIVIGNPPYINFENLNRDIDRKGLENYRTYTLKGDIYFLFCELAHSLIKRNGIVSFIISNKWLRAKSGASLRKFYSQEIIRIKQLFDFNQFMIFENAIVHSNIIISKNAPRDKNSIAYQVKDNFSLKKQLSTYLIESGVPFLEYSDEIWNIIKVNEFNIKKRVENNFPKIKNLDLKISYGIKTGLNDAFIINNLEKDKFLSQDITNSNIIKPIIRGRDTRRYYANQSNLFMIISKYKGSKEIIDKYPTIFEHLKLFENKLKNRGQVKNGQHHWLELDNNPHQSYFDSFLKPKIVFSEIVSSPQFFYDETGLYPEATTFFIQGENLKLITAILNSNCCTYLFKQFYAGGALVGKYRYKKSFLLDLPIPYENALNKIDLINELVDKIQTHHLTNTEKSIYDEQLEKIIENLYGFSSEELEIIRSNSKYNG